MNELFMKTNIVSTDGLESNSRTPVTLTNGVNLYSMKIYSAPSIERNNKEAEN